MKVERTGTLKIFEEVELGDVFTAEGGTGVYLRIEVDCDYTHSHGHDGLAVNLETGAVTWFDDTDKVVILPNAKVVC